jgi:transposase
MARKNYTDDFRRQAVDLYESTPGATLRGIADDLGISRGTLSHWVKTFGTGSTTAPINNPRTPTGRLETQAEKVVRLEAENARLRAEKAKIETEKSILRQVGTIARSGMAGMQQRAVTTLAAETIRVLDPCPRRDHAARAAVDRRRVPHRDRRHRRHCGHRHRRPTAPSTGARPPPEPLDRFAAHGVTGYRDPAGRNWLLETYAEMATRTATGQAHLTGTLDRYREQGRDLVISDSPRNAPCRPYEGNVLSNFGAGGHRPCPTASPTWGPSTPPGPRGCSIPTAPTAPTPTPPASPNPTRARRTPTGTRTGSGSGTWSGGSGNPAAAWPPWKSSATRRRYADSGPW